MEKSSDSTPGRQEDGRDLHHGLAEMDLNQLILQTKTGSAWAESDRHSIPVLKSDTLRIVLIGLHKDAELKTHQAKGMISVQVLEGSINFTTEQTKVLLEKGQMIVLHENIPHSVLALTESFFLLTLALSKQNSG